MDGNTPATPYKIFSSVNTKMMQDDEPYQIMNAAESEFLKAEALVRGIGTGITGTAKDIMMPELSLLCSFIRYMIASFVVTDAQVTNYLAIYPYNDATALEQIGTQMWLSKFMMWWDAWSDWRRTGYPVLVPSITLETHRWYNSEKAYNSCCEAAGNPNYAATATQPDKLTTKVWWDGGAE